MTECQDELENPEDQLSTADDDDFEFDPGTLYETVPAVTPELALQQKELSRNFVQHLLGISYGTLTEVLKERSEDPRLLKLFQTSVKIVQENCIEPWIPVEYWDLINSSFRWIFKELVPGNFKDIGIEEYKGITRVLGRCLVRKRTFELAGRICGSRGKVPI